MKRLGEGLLLLALGRGRMMKNEAKPLQGPHTVRFTSLCVSVCSCLGACSYANNNLH